MFHEEPVGMNHFSNLLKLKNQCNLTLEVWQQKTQL
jgi:hypothetical protein